MYVGSIEREAMDLEDYGQEENDTALHLCASRQRHKGQDNHRGSHCKCIIIQSVWKFMVCMVQFTTTEFYSLTLYHVGLHV